MSEQFEENGSEAMPQSAQLLNTVLKASSDGIVITDVHGTVIEASESFLAILGLDRRDVIAGSLGARLAELSPEAGKRWIELQQRVQSDARRGDCELELATPNGTRRLSVTVSARDVMEHESAGGLVSIWRDETERRREKMDLRFTQHAVDRATECILLMRSDGRLYYANQAACRTLGYSAEELLSLTIHDIDMGLGAEDWSAHWEDIKRRGSFTNESLFRTGEGEAIPVEVSISYRKVGTESFAYSVARDISKRRQAEEALRLIEDRYAMATRAARTGVWDWDLRTRLFFVDPIIMQLLGYEDEEFPGDIQGWSRRIHPGDREAADEAAKACLAGTTSEYSLEHRMLHKDGTVRWILARGKVVRDAAGNPIRVVGTNTDITERRQAEEELREFREIADNANYGMAVADLAGKLLYLNTNFASVHGYTVDELLGENLAVLHNDDQMNAAQEVNASLLRDGKYGPTEVWHTRRDGTVFPMLVNGIKIPADRGAPTILATTAVDISARVRAEKALKVREHQQAVVATLGRNALASGDLDMLMAETVRSVIATLEIGLCGVVELSADGKEFGLREGVGWKAGEVGRAVFAADPEWQGGLALRMAQTIVVEDAKEEVRFDQPSLFKEHGVVSSVAVPIRGWGRPFGVLTACDDHRRAFDGDDVNFLEGVANILAHALERSQAEEALASSQERLRNLAARLHAVREEERTVIAREIHDQLGQALTGLKMDLSWLMRRLPEEETVRDRANSMLALLDSTVDSVRSISTELRPPILDDLGLEAAVEWQTTEFGRQSGINCHLELRIGDRFVENEHATAAFRILQEALINVARHAHAENVTVEIKLVGDTLLLVVTDDGCGIGDATLSSAHSIGLIGMRERAAALGGVVNISQLPAGGTRVKLELPLERRYVGEAS
jgi:PAS domain S-box-containing protein